MPTTTIIEDKLAAWLIARPNVSALIGDRLYPEGGVPQGVIWPFAKYFQVAGGRVRGTTGPTGTSHARIQIDCYAATRRAAHTIGATVREELDAFGTGAMGGKTVQSLIAHDVRDMNDDPPHGEEVGQQWMMVECDVWFEETS